MDVTFKCKTNKNYVAINTLSIKLPNGSILQLDRDTTEYDLEGQDLSMTWRNCYLWSLDDCNIFGEEGYYVKNVEEFRELINRSGSQFILEEDTDKDYTVLIESFTLHE